MKIRGHETFYIRKGWLHKGVRNIIENARIFTDKENNVCDIMGVGTNQAKSIRYWLTATNICKESKVDGRMHVVLTEFGELINEFDAFHEEFGTNLLIHYKLASNKDLATAWYWFFNIYDGAIIDKEIFERELNFYLVNDIKAAESKVLGDEYSCIVKTYCADEKEEDPEEVKICPLSEIGLLAFTDKGKREVKKCMLQRGSIAPLVVYAVICDNAGDNTEIKIDELVNGDCNIGKIFNLTRIAIMDILDCLAKMGLLKVTRTAGLDYIDLNRKCHFIEAARMYYEDLMEVVQ